MALTLADAKALLPRIQAETGSGALALLLKELIHDGNLAVFGVDSTITEIDAVADGSDSTVTITDAETYTVLEEDSGKLHIFPNLTATCTVDLPAAAAGLRYRFVTKAGAADAENIVLDTTSDTNFYIGGVLWADTNAGAGADELGPVFPDGNSNSILTLVTPNAGTYVEVYCDGTNWILVHALAVSDATPTFADQA